MEFFGGLDVSIDETTIRVWSTTRARCIFRLRLQPTRRRS